MRINVRVYRFCHDTPIITCKDNPNSDKGAYNHRDVITSEKQLMLKSLESTFFL